MGAALSQERADELQRGCELLAKGDAPRFTAWLARPEVTTKLVTEGKCAPRRNYLEPYEWGTLLFWAAACAGPHFVKREAWPKQYEACVVALLASGKCSNPNIHGEAKERKWTPLYVAASHWQTTFMVRALLHAQKERVFSVPLEVEKAEYHLDNSFAWRPIHIALQKGHTQTAKLLLSCPDHTMEPESMDLHEIEFAARTCDDEGMKTMVESTVKSAASRTWDSFSTASGGHPLDGQGDAILARRMTAADAYRRLLRARERAARIRAEDAARPPYDPDEGSAEAKEFVQFIQQAFPEEGGGGVAPPPVPPVVVPGPVVEPAVVPPPPVPEPDPLPEPDPEPEVEHGPDPTPPVPSTPEREPESPRKRSLRIKCATPTSTGAPGAGAGTDSSTPSSAHYHTEFYNVHLHSHSPAGAVVLEAQRTSDHSPVVLKFMPDESGFNSSKAVRESQVKDATTSLLEAHTLADGEDAVLELGETTAGVSDKITGRKYLLVAPKMGGSLRNLIDQFAFTNKTAADGTKTRCGGLAIESKRMQLLGIMDATARALILLHASGVVNCDVKPDNFVKHPDVAAAYSWVMCDLDSCVKVGDPIRAVGTIPYMAPEVARAWLRADKGDTSVTEPSTPSIDLWSYAMMVAHMVLGKPLLPNSRATVAMLASLGIGDSLPRKYIVELQKAEAPEGHPDRHPITDSLEPWLRVDPVKRAEARTIKDMLTSHSLFNPIQTSEHRRLVEAARADGEKGALAQALNVLSSKIDGVGKDVKEQGDKAAAGFAEMGAMLDDK